MLYEKDVFYDSDCLVCFLAVRQCGILQQLFSKVIVPLVVKEEILDRGTPQYIKDSFNDLIELDFVEIRELGVGSEEYDFYENIKKEYGIGNGEAAVIALTHQNGGVIASNNLSDVCNPIEKYDLNLITTAFILAMAYENQIKSKEELDDIWKNMRLRGRKRSLPRGVNSFTQYYEEYYFKDMEFMGLN